MRREDEFLAAKSKLKQVIIGGAVLLLLILLLTFNPWAFNQPTERTVVTQMDGHQFVEFEGRWYYAGFFAKKVEWPNQIGISYQADHEDLDLIDNTVEIGQVTVQFSDGTTAKVKGIAQYILPTSEKEMLEIHNAHRTPEGLVKRRLAPYTKECLQSSAQLMNSEMHYSGGKAQMTQNYLNQLQYGSYLLNVRERLTYDSSEKITKRNYAVEIQEDNNHQPKRKFSSIKEYNIKVSDANIVDTDYETAVDSMLAQKIKSSTRASVSRQELMTAQQQAQTSKAQGEKALVDMEYRTKLEQTKQVVAAETQVQLAEQDRQKQKIALEASILEAQKIKTLADANAYEKQRLIQADGALDQKLEAWKFEREKAWEAFAKYQGNMVPTYISGSAGGYNAMDWMQVTGMKALQDLNTSVKSK